MAILAEAAVIAFLLAGLEVRPTSRSSAQDAVGRTSIDNWPRNTATETLRAILHLFGRVPSVPRRARRRNGIGSEPSMSQRTLRQWCRWRRRVSDGVSGTGRRLASVWENAVQLLGSRYIGRRLGRQYGLNWFCSSGFAPSC